MLTEILKSLNSKSFVEISPLQLAKLFEITVDMERKALGIATINDEVKLNQAGERLNIHKQLIQNKLGDDLEDSTGFLEGIEKIENNIWAEGNIDKTTISK